ncbi:hypothetical protein CDAR_371101 [Caerostris darwini]|uniref:Uncharacterized protein n=1 Tax=Caerostris darwini TaxID=1538125 RepID=A0AAV4QB62_9ARAC|nr:hypothetical protein CDAR_371101 [Caerostris darwini]
MDGLKSLPEMHFRSLEGKKKYFSSIDGQLSISGNTACQKLRLRWSRYSKRNSGTTARGAQSFHSSVLDGAHETTLEVKRCLQSNCSSFPFDSTSAGLLVEGSSFLCLLLLKN